jgi:hypothetical protein
LDKRDANIDIVFRNGLKDFEVIPPSEIWENINPKIRTKQTPVLIIRVAASVAILSAITFLTYEYNRQGSSSPDNSIMAVNYGAESTITNSLIQGLPIIVANEINPVSREAVTDLLVTPDSKVEEINQMITSPEIIFLSEARSLPANFKGSGNDLAAVSLNKSQKNSLWINEPGFQYSIIENPKKVAERWSVAAMASPTYYSHFNSGGSEVTKQLISSEKTIISYSGGVAFSYKVSKRVSVQSGLYYASLGQVVDGINSFAGFQKYNYSKGDHSFEVLTSNGTIYTRNADVFLSATGPVDRISTNYTSDVFDPSKVNLQYINSTINQNFSYLELPVLVRYKVIDRTIDLNLIGGVSYNLLVNNSVYTTVNGSKYPIGETEKLNPLSVSSTLGMGMEYNFSEKLSLNLEPTLRYYLNPISGTTGSNVHPYSFGIFSGLSYRF